MDKTKLKKIVKYLYGETFPYYISLTNGSVGYELPPESFMEFMDILENSIDVRRDLKKFIKEMVDD